MSKNEQEEIMTPTFRVSFPTILKPGQNDRGEDVYGVTMLFDHPDDLKPLKKLALKAAKEKWGDKYKKIRNFKWPFKCAGSLADFEGDPDSSDIDLDKYPNFENKVWCDANTKFAPGLVDQKRQPILDEDGFYAGCYGRAIISAYAYEHKEGGKGVTLMLTAIQKVKDGEKFGGRPDAGSLFDEVEMEEGDLSEFEEEDELGDI
jgi:hypothetical protein